MSTTTIDPKTRRGALPPTTPIPEFADNHESIRIMGFWVFLATDVVLFASLFSVYAVARGRLALGAGPHQIFTLGPVLAETLILLSSTFTVSLSVYTARLNRLKASAAWLIATLVLGVGFVTLEFREFAADVAAGYTWHHSAFLSAFFTLVGTHGSHVSFGIGWAIMLAIQLLMRGLTTTNRRKLYTFALYWHFLDIIWIFLFSLVYLTGMA